jgi:hypothetical protein
LGELELSFVDSTGRGRGEASLHARFVLLGARGPVCLAEGRYRAVARARAGAGRVLLELRAPE